MCIYAFQNYIQYNFHSKVLSFGHNEEYGMRSERIIINRFRHNALVR